MLHCGNLTKQKELLDVGLKLKKKFSDYDIRINSITLRKIMQFVARVGISRRRCNIGSDIVVNFSEGILYTCPENARIVIGSLSGSLSKNLSVDLSAKEQYKHEGSKVNAECKHCDLALFCGSGCSIKGIKTQFDSCKEYNAQSLQLILDNFEEFFDISFE